MPSGEFTPHQHLKHSHSWRGVFEAAGGRDFAYLTCLNDTPPGMAMLEALVRRELAGWY